MSSDEGKIFLSGGASGGMGRRVYHLLSPFLYLVARSINSIVSLLYCAPTKPPATQATGVELTETMSTLLWGDQCSKITRVIVHQRDQRILVGQDSSVPLMRHDPSDLGSLILIRIILKERTHMS